MLDRPVDFGPPMRAGSPEIAFRTLGLRGTMHAVITWYHVLLIAHISAAVLTLGPLTAANSRFPKLLSNPDRATTPGAAEEVHRATRLYGWAAASVPGIGCLLAIHTERFDQWWIWVALALNLLAPIFLLGIILPTQKRAIRTMAVDRSDTSRSPQLRRLRRIHAAASTTTSLMWMVTLTLMVWKPS